MPKPKIKRGYANGEVCGPMIRGGRGTVRVCVARTSLGRFSALIRNSKNGDFVDVVHIRNARTPSAAIKAATQKARRTGRI